MSPANEARRMGLAHPTSWLAGRGTAQRNVRACVRAEGKEKENRRKGKAEGRGAKSHPSTYAGSLSIVEPAGCQPWPADVFAPQTSSMRAVWLFYLTFPFLVLVTRQLKPAVVSGRPGRTCALKPSSPANPHQRHRERGAVAAAVVGRRGREGEEEESSCRQTLRRTTRLLCFRSLTTASFVSLDRIPPWTLCGPWPSRSRAERGCFGGPSCLFSPYRNKPV
ncbi:hypothetical protein GGS23DRAFT_565410 [Durotheca rogersii]|uniref:uncharacterized protein n=1 Tax=Durotheca rogersii TaxID=419775 RepID=UPI002220A0BA|nr:uncharacterized protein GGS23DRAFT_565410 [Durotheca rogersii]KAI5863796.1 hypothetical protein GGS23DRAFT_565410 [Durotheca rogersii]